MPLQGFAQDVRGVPTLFAGGHVLILPGFEADRVMELSSLTPTVEKVFRLTRMNEVFRILPGLHSISALLWHQA